MASQYKQKRAVLASELEQAELPQPELLITLYERYCASPFPKSVGFAPFWLRVWQKLSPPTRQKVANLPDPCLNHLEKRDVKPERGECLREGLSRMLAFDEEVTVEGLRLYPHETARSAEVIGPLAGETWVELCDQLRGHRLWQVASQLSESELWEVAERMRPHRDLPQPMLDYLDGDRPKDKAPWQEFEESLQRFVLRRKIEQMRDATYRTLREHDIENQIKAGLST